MKVLFPCESLSPYIEAYYLSTPSQRDTFEVRFPVISTAYIKLSPTSAIVSGQTTEPVIAGTEFGDRGFGVKLRVGAFYALFGVPACEITNRVVRLDIIWGRTATELIEQLAEEEPSLVQIQRFEQILTQILQGRSQSERSIEQRAVTALQQTSATTVSQLAEELGYSSRQLQRKLNQFVGLSPRFFKRICRFEKAVELIQRSADTKRINWAAVAFACGYSDQAHFARDFHAFAGCTPTAYRASLPADY